MSDRPPPPFSVPPGAPSDPQRAPWVPNPPTDQYAPNPYAPPPPVAPPPAMPPLGPPYATQAGQLPAPHYPLQPPEQWPQQPPLLPPPAPPGQWPGSGHPPGGGGRDRSRWIVAGAIGLVVVVLLAFLISETGGDGSLQATPPRSSSSSATASSSSDDPTTTTTTAPDDLDAVVLEIQDFVERERGLQFKQDVSVRLAGDAEFQDLLLQDFDESQAALSEEGDVLIALGLLDPGTDVIEEMRTLLEIGVVGFYDPETKELVVRGTDTTPYVREVLAHELTHALDDQSFDLDRPQLDNPDDETGYGFLGLVEGNARRIEDAYLASLSLQEQEDAFREQTDLLTRHPEIYDVPQILITLIQSPYEDGPPFVDAVLDEGQGRLDASFATPPTTSEQILHPERFLAGQGAVAVPVPSPDGAGTNVGVLGELTFREILFASIGSANQVERAVDGWGGDSYVTWIDATGRRCLRDTFVGDTTGDTRELVQSVQEWAIDHGATVDAPGDGAATLTVCS